MKGKFLLYNRQNFMQSKQLMKTVFANYWLMQKSYNARDSDSEEFQNGLNHLLPNKVMYCISIGVIKRPTGKTLENKEYIITYTKS